MIEQLRCRVVRVPLGAGPGPADVVRLLAGAPGLVCLTGAWAGGGAVIASDPLVRADGPEALSRRPLVEGDGADAVAGGWLGSLAFSGPSHLAFYDHVLRLSEGHWWFEALWSDQRDAALQARRNELEAVLATAPPGARELSIGPLSGPHPEEHLRAVETAIGAIRDGEIYQVNVCTRLAAPFAGDPIEVFARLMALQPAYGAYLDTGDTGDTGDGAIVSASPELFLKRRGRTVITKPIKGTLPRDVPGNDEALRRSTKDAAENVMIVDLMRNDLGRVSAIGTVRAAALLDVEAHPGVWHLVSTITGTLREDVDDADLLRATFPPGSVTGAPKLRALGEIAAVETVPRGAYTGAIGLASPVWGAEFSVAIRTFEIGDGRIELGVGGGVTADSVPMLEWHECLHKARPLLAAIGAAPAADLAAPTPEVEEWQRAGGLLETVLVWRGIAVHLADHLARLDRSAREIYGHGCPVDLAVRVRAAAAAAGERAVLRVVLTDNACDVSTAPLGGTPSSSRACVVRGRDGLWRHKWADRSRLSEDEKGGPPLYVAADGTVLETSRGNVFLLRPDGSLVTPPLRDDLLPGITRQALLDLARDQARPVEIRSFGLDELISSAAFWTSSLSGAVAIQAVDDVELPRQDDQLAALRTALSSGD